MKKSRNILTKIVDEYTYTCQGYSMTEIFLSSIIECNRTVADTEFFNKELRKLCIFKQFWIYRINVHINKADFWRNGMDLHKSGMILRSGLSPSKKICFICLNESSLKIKKNALYFILKDLFVLKIFKFLSWLFGRIEKTAWFER